MRQTENFDQIAINRQGQELESWGLSCFCLNIKNYVVYLTNGKITERISGPCIKNHRQDGNSLVVQSGFHAFTAMGLGSLPGWGTEIPQAAGEGGVGCSGKNHRQETLALNLRCTSCVLWTESYFPCSTALYTFSRYQIQEAIVNGNFSFSNYELNPLSGLPLACWGRWD